MIKYCFSNYHILSQWLHMDCCTFRLQMHPLWCAQGITAYNRTLFCFCLSVETQW